MQKNILILGCGYLYASDAGFGYHVWKALEKMKLPANVDLMEVGFSACMIPHVMEGMDKLIIIDIFYTGDAPGTVVRLRQEEVPLRVSDGKTDAAKSHLMDTLNQIALIGKCPESIFIGVVPIDTMTESEQLTPEIASKVPVVIDMILKEIEATPPR
jgi:hydrogenase maturation protease